MASVSNQLRENDCSQIHSRDLQWRNKWVPQQNVRQLQRRRWNPQINRESTNYHSNRWVRPNTWCQNLNERIEENHGWRWLPNQRKRSQCRQDWYKLHVHLCKQHDVPDRMGKSWYWCQSTGYHVQNVPRGCSQPIARVRNSILVQKWSRQCHCGRQTTLKCPHCKTHWILLQPLRCKSAERREETLEMAGQKMPKHRRRSIQDIRRDESFARKRNARRLGACHYERRYPRRIQQ